MATAEVMMPSALPTSPIKRKRESVSVTPLVKIAPTPPAKVAFDPAKHIQFPVTPKTKTMQEIGLEGKGVSPVAVSEPFQLFSPAAIEQMRAEILNQDVWTNCQYSSNLAACQLRGYAAKYAPFIYDAWKNSDVLAIISKIAGVELVPVVDFEIGHINISVQSEEEKREALKAVAEKASRDADEGVAGCPWEDDSPIVGWHTDSYPFVCVTMLSDCTDMIGGETALRQGNGEIIKVRGPGQGCAVVLQGRYIEHQALRALGQTERITMVTSFRPKSSVLPDDTVLTTVRCISNLSDLYFEFCEYRLEMLEERIRKQMKEMRSARSAGRPFNTKKLKEFLAEQEKFLAHMNSEIVSDELVTKGHVDDSHLFMEEYKKKKRAA